jgi:hypothetical protein
MSTFWGLVNIAKQAAIASGEMYRMFVISSRWRWTRSLADKRRFGRVGNGTLRNSIFWRRGADPPKNVSVIIGASESSVKHTRKRDLRAGNV